MLNFAQAFELLTRGTRVTREDWVNRWARYPEEGGAPVLVLIPGSRFTVETGRPLGDGCPELVGHQVDYHPHIDIVTGTKVRVWEPTQVDLFAIDWRTVP